MKRYARALRTALHVLLAFAMVCTVSLVAPADRASAAVTTTDHINDWSKIHSKTSDWKLDTTTPSNYNNDASRAKRGSDTVQSITWKYDNISHVNFKVYFFGTTTTNKVKAYTSPNNSTWTQLSLNQSSLTASANGWHWATFTPSGSIPSGTHYIRVEFANDVNKWAPQLSEITITHTPIVATSTYYGKRLEPKGTTNGRIIHGASKDFTNYSDHVGPNKPAIFGKFRGLDTFSASDSGTTYATGILNEINTYKSSTDALMFQLSLSMTVDGQPSLHYEHTVANTNQYDSHIDQLVIALEQLAANNVLVYLRIGYEFNGSWNGYGTTTYKNAWIKIHNKIRAKSSLNNKVALVWCMAADGASNYMDWYPGNQYVDWWGADIFNASHFNSTLTNNFLNSASSNQFPVFIGETTPRHVGTTDGLEDWNAWFDKLFSFVRSKPGVKGFIYINRDWSTTQWPDWGDARISSDPTGVIPKKLAEELSNPVYIHRGTFSSYQSKVNAP